MSEDLATEALTEFLNAVEAGIAAARRLISEAKGVKAVREETFNILQWEKQTGARIGEFQSANKAHNPLDKWERAYQILRRNNATIANRYHGPNYVYSYWIYNDRIYRQLLKR